LNNFNRPSISYKKIFLFWLPLAGTWLMMSVEGPYLSAIIARMSEPKYNLAAYGVAFSFALIAEAPIMMIMSAATALVEDKFTFLKLRNFTYTLNTVLTILFILFLIPPVFNFLALDLINLPTKVAELTHVSLFILLPWPGAIGYRRFYQGVLVKHNMTKRVAYGTVVRLLTMSITAFTLFSFSTLPGAVVGACALSAGVITEAIASRVMSLSLMRTILSSDKTIAVEELTYKKIAIFYYPLALTSLLSLGVHPIVTFFMGQGIMSLESLAVLPVINALVFIFRSIGLSYQEVGIALMGKNFANYIYLRNFAFAAGIIVVVTLSIIAFTPLADFWFNTVSGLTPELTDFAKLPLRIIAVIPGLSVLISFQRAILVYARKTQPVTTATTIEVAGIILILFVGISLFNIVGVVAATSAFLIGRLCANIYLSFPYKKAVKV
jgi:O-antigen/teichoic acid export membrane protein